jgi:hypothetical protein
VTDPSPASSDPSEPAGSTSASPAGSPRGSSSTPSSAAEREAALLAGEFLPSPSGTRPRSAFRRTALFVVGLLMVVAGIVLGIIPVVPGFPLTIAGLLMMAAGSSVTRSLLNQAEAKLPQRWRLALRRIMRRCGSPRTVP